MEEPLSLGWEGRRLRLAGSKGRGRQAVGSCTESVVWERRPRLSPQRFSCGWFLGGWEGGVVREVEAIPGRLLPGWELALGPFSGYILSHNRVWLFGVQRQKRDCHHARIGFREWNACWPLLHIGGSCSPGRGCPGGSTSGKHCPTDSRPLEPVNVTYLEVAFCR